MHGIQYVFSLMFRQNLQSTGKGSKLELFLGRQESLIKQKLNIFRIMFVR